MNNIWPEDEIRIERLEIYAYHGVHPKERRQGQTFVVNATMYTDTHKAGATDDLSCATDYGAVCMFIDKWMRENTYQLLETVLDKLSKAVLLQFELIHSMDLEIRKPEAPIELTFSSVSVKVRRGWHKVYLSVGSNMGDRRKYIDDAVEALKAQQLIRKVKVSELIETAPYGYREQDDFLNGIIELETLFTPEELLNVLHETENAAGRERKIHWGPRTLDLDILFYDDEIYRSESLVIPHIDLQNREFVLKPLITMAPELRHPIFGKSVYQLLEELQKKQ